MEIKANDITTLTYKDEQLNGIRIRKVDADTGRGIYGVRIMVTDENNDVVGMYTTDHQGYIEIDKELPDGIYYLEEIEAAPGYDLDKVVKRIRIENGKTKVIVWENAREKGQIQILKTSADANPITGQPAGSRLEGAVFEIGPRGYGSGGRLHSERLPRRGGVRAASAGPLCGTGGHASDFLPAQQQRI